MMNYIMIVLMIVVPYLLIALGVIGAVWLIKHYIINKHSDNKSEE